MSREKAKEVIENWIKVRESYLKNPSERNEGLAIKLEDSIAEVAKEHNLIVMGDQVMLAEDEERVEKKDIYLLLEKWIEKFNRINRIEETYSEIEETRKIAIKDFIYDLAETADFGVYRKPNGELFID